MTGKNEFDVELRLIEYEDLSLLKDWRNDSEIMARTRQWRLLSFEDQKKWFESLYKDKWPNNLMYMIQCYHNWTEQKTLNSIGVCGLCHIDYILSCAEVSVYIGDNNYKREGIGLKTLEELKKIAFNNMRLNYIWAEIYTFNEPGINLFKKSGFENIGFKLNTCILDGKYAGSYFYQYRRKVWK